MSFMSEDAFREVRHSPVEAIGNCGTPDGERDGVHSMIAPVPPPGRRSDHAAPQLRPRPPSAGADFGRPPSSAGLRAHQQQQHPPRAYGRGGPEERSGSKIYNNDLFGELAPDAADPGAGANTLNQPARPGREAHESTVSSQRLENQKELQAARRRERKLVGVMKSNDTNLMSARPGSASQHGPPPPAQAYGAKENGGGSSASPSGGQDKSSPDTVLDKSVHSGLKGPGLLDGAHCAPAVVTKIEKEARASGITSMEYDPSESKRSAGASSASDPRFELLGDGTYALRLAGAAGDDQLRRLLSGPGPRGGKVRCYIRRDKGLRGKFPTYHLFMEEGDAFLLSARRRKRSKSSNYLVSTDPEDLARDSESYFGKARSNFVGTEFTLYDDGISGRKAGTSSVHLRKEVGAVTYETNVFGTKGPRKMAVYVPRLFEGGDTERDFLDGSGAGLIDSYKSGDARGILALRNKQPHWNEELCAYCLNFNGRVTKASVKNFQLEDVDAEGRAADSTVYLQFGKVGEDRFTMDFQYPLSALQSFMICLTSFDNKMACE